MHYTNEPVVTQESRDGSIGTYRDMIATFTL